MFTCPLAILDPVQGLDASVLLTIDTSSGDISTSSSNSKEGVPAQLWLSSVEHGMCLWCLLGICCQHCQQPME